MWRTCKESGRPFPVLDDDDVIDHMIVETIAIRWMEMEQEANEQAKRDAWKKDKSSLEHLR